MPLSQKGRDPTYMPVDVKDLDFTDISGVISDAQHGNKTTIPEAHHKPYWILVEEKEITANTTRVTFSNLDLNSAKAYMLLFNVRNPTVYSVSYRLFYNGDEVETNYYNQHLTASGTSVVARRGNNAIFADAFSPGMSSLSVYFIRRLPDGHVSGNGLPHYNEGDTLAARFRIHHYNKTVDNVTRIDIVAGRTGAIGKGSSMLLFKAM